MAIVSRLLRVTQGNINNHHLYLKQVQDLFPADALGGANSSHSAPRTVRILWGNEAVDTDIDCSKAIFRKRAWVARFFAENRIRAGDRVLLEQLEPYLYRLSKVPSLPRAEPQPLDPVASDAKQVVSLGTGLANEDSVWSSKRRPGQGAQEGSLRDSIVRRDRSTCQSCGCRTRGQVHHIVPRSQGGPDTPANLVTLCGRCHMLISPIRVDVLCREFRISLGELLVQKSKVEIAVHSWVLAHAEETGMESVRPEEGQYQRCAPLVRQRVESALTVPKWKQLRPRAGKPWTEEEDAALLRDFDAGLPLEEIARRRQRGIHAIEVRLYKLGMARPGRCDESAE